MQAGIVFDKVAFSYDAEVLLSEVDVQIPKETFCLVVGPNGAGKTTFLRLAAGLLMPQQGAVWLDGQAVPEAQRNGLLHLVPQLYNKNAAQFPATVEEIIDLALRQDKGLTMKLRRSRVEEALSLVGMESFAKRRIGELSGGQQQRVMIAQGLARHPQYLLLDEPTSGIDFSASEHIFNLLQTLNKEMKMTIVMVTHDILEATKAAEQVLCINRHICYHGDCEGFLQSHLHTALAWHIGG